MSYKKEYLDAQLRARAQFVKGGLTPKMLRTLFIEYSNLLIEITEIGRSGGKLSEERIRGMVRSINEALSGFRNRLVKQYGEAQTRAFEIAVNGHTEGLARVSKSSGISLSANFHDVPTLASEMMMVRRGIDSSYTFKTLINRNIVGISGDVDKYLRSALVQGTSAEKATGELASLMARDNPDLKEALRLTGPKGGRTRAAIREGIPFHRTDIVRVESAKSLLNDARRLVFTELNTSFDEADKLAAMMSPVVEAVHWTLSSVHPAPDVCDMLAEADYYGLGTGVYPPAVVPAYPHPWCQCATEKIIREPKDWKKAKTKFGEPKIKEVGKSASGFDSFNGKNYARSLTKSQIKTVTKHAHEAVEKAYEAGLKFDLDKLK